LYIIFRTLGKISGSYLGARIVSAPKSVRQGVGLSILPQGGVEIGMLVAVSLLFPKDEAILIKTIVLAGILFFQVIGPIMFKLTLEHFGEIKKNR
jgi:hypothetical protein